MGINLFGWGSVLLGAGTLWFHRLLYRRLCSPRTVFNLSLSPRERSRFLKGRLRICETGGLFWASEPVGRDQPRQGGKVHVLRVEGGGVFPLVGQLPSQLSSLIPTSSFRRLVKIREDPRPGHREFALLSSRFLWREMAGSVRKSRVRIDFFLENALIFFAENDERDLCLLHSLDSDHFSGLHGQSSILKSIESLVRVRILAYRLTFPDLKLLAAEAAIFGVARIDPQSGDLEIVQGVEAIEGSLELPDTKLFEDFATRLRKQLLSD